MKLEKIVLDGFKSFADRTEFTFDNPVTGIVGPNGCGKSNIVDAVKWVFGEQSAKSLRSGRMADVIFSGSSSRKPAGSAEVSLFIANSNGTGRIAIDADEVQVTRRIYQSGASEYRINNKLCRLRDIKELFMDTGVGVKAYSIIEQGQIERLLSASSKERREIFEEAAGISKYKAHKAEALRKLERTEQNLLRLADILGEVASRLRSVKLAAGKARNYLAYSQRLKELQVNYSLAEYDKIYTAQTDKKRTLDEVEKQFAAAAAEAAKLDANVSELAQRITEAENEINRTDNSLLAVQSKIEQLCQKIEFLHTRMRELEQRKTSACERMEKLNRQEKLLESDLAKYEREQAESERAFEEKSRSIEQIEQAISELNGQCASLEQELEDEKSGIIDIVRRTAQLHNEVQSISVYRSSLSSQKERLAGRAQTAKAQLETLMTAEAQYNARLQDIEKVLAELAQKLNDKQRQEEQNSERIEGDLKRLGHSKEALSALNSEFSILTDMESRREGLESDVKEILDDRSRFDYVEGLVADIISAEMEYAPAVEAVLEGKTDAVVVNNTSRLLADRERLQKLAGRVSFICADRTEPFVDSVDLSGLEQVKGRVVEFVRYEDRYAPLVWQLLGKTIVVDSIETAVGLTKRLGGGYEFVTLKGEYYNGDGAIRLGPIGKAAGLISRKSRLRQLDGIIDEIKGQIKTIADEIEKNKRSNEHTAKLCQELRTAVYEANTEKTQVNSQIGSLRENIKRLRDEQPLIASEMDMLAEQIAQSVQKEYDSKQKLAELEQVNAERNERIKQLEAAYVQRKSELQKLTDSLTELKISAGQIAEHSSAAAATIASLTGQMKANTAATETAREEAQTCSRQAEQAQRDILSCEAKVSELFAAKDQRQQSSGVLRKQIDEMSNERNRAEELLRQKHAEQGEIDEKIGELKIETGQLEVKCRDLIERVRDELQIDLAESYRTYQDSEVDFEQVRGEIAELRGRIERLGNVNIDAIAEQETLEQRYEFLSAQVQDLNSSKGQLQQLINRLNRLSREKFTDTFELVRGHFQEIFRKLFGGGKADIVLEEGEDVLEAGIEITARPPGKQTRSISLLSGGEKAMTAIALLFSVFKARPSPFCFLDEVDAALDEANNERFNMLIKQFQRDSQFIIITHAKRTMSISDVLYGITMQTKGVSKKISVSFERYETEPAAA